MMRMSWQAPTEGDSAKSKKGRVVIPVRNTSSHPVLHFYHRTIPKCIRATERKRNLFSNKTKGDNSKIKKARVVNLVCDTSSCPDLHFYHLSSKYSKGYSSYIADKKFYADANGIRLENNILPPLVGWGHKYII